MSVTKNQSNADAMAAMEALVTAANTKFIAAADAAIALAVAQGHYKVTLMAFENVSLKDIADYYGNLGYLVSYPPFPPNRNQPARLFGSQWEAYWNNRQVCLPNDTHKVKIDWN